MVFLGFKDLHGFHDDLKIIRQKVNRWPQVQKKVQPKKRRPCKTRYLYYNNQTVDYDL